MVVPAATSFLRRRSVALLVLLILTVYGFEAHARRRVKSAPITLGDQDAYLGYARHLYESNYTVVEDRNRMPVYPFLLSLIYEPGMTDADFLARAQKFTVNLSIFLLLLLFFVFRRFFSPLYSVALLAATAFGVFIYRVDRAQTEMLFYFVSFCAFALLLQLLRRPGWKLAILAGATTGLAHLTKASVLPALAAWIAAFGARTLCDPNRFRGPRLATLILVPATFLAVVFPYIQTSKRIYDAYFYNVNSTFVVWCDSSSQAYDFLSHYGDKDQWRSLPSDQLPSFRKYWREHSVARILRRIGRGALDLATQNARAIGYYKFVIAILVAGIVLATRRTARLRELVTENRFAAAFCIMFLSGYYLLYAWYDAIINDTRFILAIFLPFLFAGSFCVLRMGRDRLVSIAGRRMTFESFFAGLLLSLTLIDVLYCARDLAR
jgi:hypothetical protein